MRAARGGPEGAPGSRLARWRARGLPAAAYASWRASLPAELGDTRILAWTRTGTGWAVGTPASFSAGDPAGWRHVGWHEIERGGWDAADQTLRWHRYEGPEETVELAEPGRLPELFAERVAATIAVERFVPVAGGGRGVVVTARRQPGGTLRWHATPTGGLRLDSPAGRAVADRALAELRAEYDPG